MCDYKKCMSMSALKPVKFVILCRCRHKQPQYHISAQSLTVARCGIFKYEKEK